MPESRRTVTIVFSDVSGSTALGEQLDPEAVRRIIGRFFEEAQTVLEHHGGKVEKFIGDAVMAVFGIPQLHEDDALRAVRAAAELRARLAGLNEEFERDRGVQIAIRTGVNTGEVVTGDADQGHAFATGDAVNVAARLEQAAGPGEILIGDATRRLLPENVRVEAVEAPLLKGKIERVRTWRLVEILPDVPAFMRRLDTPFVGREHELAILEAAFTSVAEERVCRLVTVFGPPGVGKSRLARELLSLVGPRARVVIGRCLAYGEGITYWPLAEIVQQVAGRDRAGLAEIVASDESAGLIADRIAGAIGLASAGGRSEEISWAVRKLLEALAANRPLVVVLDDIHWAEPTFLDLIEYLAGFTSGPILLLALARPDLLEERASWATPRPNAQTIVLQPLAQRDAAALIGGLASHAVISTSARARIVEAAEGNPLFVEQMLALEAEDGGDDGEQAVPPTIQALLAARIDRLDPEERAVIARASVEGRSFHRGAVSELLPESTRGALGGHLMSLVRKEFIRPDQAVFAGDDGFRFAHNLVRDAAYGAMAKELRADLHERFADWLAKAAEERVAEYEQILGYHLEQSHRYLADLGPTDEHAQTLARRAAGHLLAAAERAIARGDRLAQVSLLSRSVALLPAGDRMRLDPLAELGDALVEAGQFARAEDVLVAAAAAADAAGDTRIEARARLGLSKLRYSTQPGEIEQHRREAELAIGVFEEAGDELGLARAWDLIASVHYGQGQSAAAEAAWEESIRYARGADSRRDELSGLSSLASVALWGPCHRLEADERCENILARVKGDLEEEAYVLGVLGCLRALEGRFDDARALHRRRSAIFEELGLQLAPAWNAHTEGWVEMLAGDAAAAEDVLRRGYEMLERMGAKTQLQVVGSYLARALTLQGRYAEAEGLAEAVEELDPTGIAEIAAARCARAKAAARLGRPEEGERLARAAVAQIDRTDFLIDRADARVDLAEVLLLGGGSDESGLLLREARELNERKGNIVSAERVDTLLAELGGESAAS
jgi:class 3 adenylate cyclase/tetratricopeptide (TPR) repeat protein